MDGHEAARKELKLLDALWPAAQTNFAGAEWERSWEDWSTRRDAARKHLEELRHAGKTAEKSALNKIEIFCGSSRTSELLYDLKLGVEQQFFNVMAKKFIAALADSGLFLQEWIANPQRTGSVAPSSPQLAAAMARWLPSDPESYVLELGPGTGAVTEALFKRGLREDRLVAIENNPTLARLLRKRFPRARIITGDAWHLDELLLRPAEPIDSVGAVISSLPLVNFPVEQAETAGGKNPRRAGTAGDLGAIQLSHPQAAHARYLAFPPARLQNRLAQSPARPRQRVSEVTPDVWRGKGVAVKNLFQLWDFFNWVTKARTGARPCLSSPAFSPLFPPPTARRRPVFVPAINSRIGKPLPLNRAQRPRLAEGKVRRVIHPLFSASSAACCVRQA